MPGLFVFPATEIGNFNLRSVRKDGSGFDRCNIRPERHRRQK